MTAFLSSLVSLWFVVVIRRTIFHYCFDLVNAVIKLSFHSSGFKLKRNPYGCTRISSQAWNAKKRTFFLFDMVLFYFIAFYPLQNQENIYTIQSVHFPLWQKKLFSFWNFLEHSFLWSGTIAIIVPNLTLGWGWLRVE